MNDSNDIQALRAKLHGTRGRTYWRSLEEVAGTPEFKEFLHREFPQNASEWLDPVGRRGFLKLMGASMALAGVSACTRQPAEDIVPYVRQPEEMIPGKPLFFAWGHPARNRRNHPELFRWLDDPALFEPVATYDAVEVEHLMRVVRYTGRPLPEPTP